ncbi:MAG: hypothetical protein HDS73_02000 [Bacteroidales bacterium]|nr:hypothetical protein [Bacteroidales bacterium]
MKSKLMAGGILSLSALAWAAKDPVVMKINGVDVPKSEFEYLFKKNSQQQIEPQPLEKYVDMFAIYKMKVADAKAHGLDTLPEFRKEMDQYAAELAQPFLLDTVYVRSLADKMWKNMHTEAEAKHIMVLKVPGADAAGRQKADSIRNLLLKGASFEELAASLSDDPSSNGNGGSMGYIVAGKFPYAFEEAVFDTPEGKYSDVVETFKGFHIVKGGKKIPARGSIQAAHIMKSVAPNASDEEKAKAKAEIDSIYALIQSDPTLFESLAVAHSDDKRSGQKGGMLAPFVSGDMVPSFNEAAYSLSDGEISAPVQSPYGWHIIRRFEVFPLPEKDVVYPRIMDMFANPSGMRHDVVQQHQLETYKKKYRPQRNKRTIEALHADVRALGLDSLLVAKYSEPAQASLPLLTINKKTYTVAELLPALRRFHYGTNDFAVSRLDDEVDKLEARFLREEAVANLQKEQPEFRNLLNEYRDGSLLYEMSVRRVWDRAGKDKEGLQKYFEEHRDEFAWSEPHVKGYLVQAANDSVAENVRLRLQQLPEEEYVKTIRKEFKGEAAIDKILMTRGQNPLVDNLVFGEAAATPQNPAFTTYFLYDQKILTEPEDVQDAKVVVTNAYQNELENEWVDELKARYPVVIYDKELKKIK